MASYRALRVCRLNNVPKTSTRSAMTLSPTAPLPMEPAEQAHRDQYHARIGNRDVVGHGRNGLHHYLDNIMYPYPAIRWEQNTAQSKTLMDKAQGDWKNLTMEEKKLLYRHSFCQTFAELKAPTGEWKIVWALTFVVLIVSFWWSIFMRRCVYDATTPSTFTKEHQQAQIERMVMQRQGLISGVSSKYDYENERFTK
ncbi:cytochrome c oxidase subunit 4 isoform 1, mitochondrial-like [Watersipora subatra]|uniref:cytochrome c oxidase subunit 4 isoform 1, mitochondrial-like n=1 Tax=Watersipora subatra TaxID=2589382 RepID=UPI00355B2402